MTQDMNILMIETVETLKLDKKNITSKRIKKNTNM